MDPLGLNTAAAAYTLVQHALSEMRSSRDKIRDALAALPVLSKEAMAGVDLEEPCPICLVPLSTVFAEEAAAASAKEKDDAEEDEAKEGSEEKEPVGVTKLEECGHVFCRRDLTEWIRSQHGSCPTCRHTFLNILPLSVHDDDDESSDGGEYIPNPEDFEDEDEDAFIDVDGFTDTDADDFPAEGMDVDFGDIWGEHSDAFALGIELECDVEGDSIIGDSEMGDVDDEYEEEENDASFEWGLTDGESESMTSSEAGDITLGDEAVAAVAANVLDREVSVSVHEDEDANAKEGEGINADANASTLDVSQRDKETSSS